jgi:WD40 repeat protein
MKPDYHVFHSMSFIPESTLLFVSLESGSFDILDWDTGECLHEFRNISKLCAAVLSPDGKFIAAPSCENRIEIRDSLTSEILFKFPGRCDIDVELLFSPNSRLIAVSGEGTIHIWDWASSTHLYRLEKRHSGVKRINRIAFSADSVLVMSSSDLEIAIWNCQTGDCNFK